MPDAATPPPGLTQRPQRTGPPRLQPSAAQNRNFRDIEDVDWSEIAVVAGRIYRVDPDGDLRWMKHYGFRFLDVPTLSGGVGA